MKTDCLECSLAGRCSGCTWIDRPYSDQLREKAEVFRVLWSGRGLPDVENLSIRRVAPGHLRDRADLVFMRVSGESRLGLYDVDRSEVLALGECPQMSPPLQQWFDEFRKNPPPIQKGSIRLRVSPEGKRGVWLDFANLDVKALLDDGVWLNWLAEQAIVEIGQKKKRLQRKDQGFRLADPEFEFWLPTFTGGETLRLYSVIGSFTQAGAEANRVIVDEFVKSLPEVSGRWLELGSGIGNFTLPLAKLGAEVTAVELDPLANLGLERAALEAGLAEKVRIRRMSFQHSSPELKEALSGCAGIVADPPRSGLQNFPSLLEEVPPGERPAHFVYVSCFAESMVEDAVRLAKLGYRLKRIVGVDQFPQTPHCEFIARFERT